ncbi:hypothetical protein P43SY_004814 [Pythium insidiosum]|uniref:Regulator of microtubule dynamics protein 1 n=1 Tax=Pythium insidiosum TaxID=114742 RepID=A0AAD5M109_PYTIN|nr:hypothetical protein P43SY_004814 [Pythium insidiosum]
MVFVAAGISLAITVTGSVVAAETYQDSAVALLAEERYNDYSYSRQQLLEDLKAAHAKHPSDVGVMWRLGRAAYDVSNLRATPAEEKKALIYFALEIMGKALELGDNVAEIMGKALELGDNVAEVHNWYGIVLSSVGDYEGTKVSIANSYKIKEHWERAIALKPTKATTYHLLGRWCVRISDLSWIERKAAAVLFGAPPESSYQEALGFLLKCHEFDSQWKSNTMLIAQWKSNTMLIAQVYFKLKDYSKAKEWAEKTLAIPNNTEEDEDKHEEAKALLKKL